MKGNRRHFLSLSACFLSAAISISALASHQPLSVDKNGFVGVYAQPSTASKTNGVLVLGGSEGGIPEKLAAPIIRAGYPTLALAYFNEAQLPQELEQIPLEYVDQAVTWLTQQPGTNTDEVTVVGWSKGAELALVLASRDARITRVIAIAPSSVVWAGILKDWTKVPASSWTAGGEDLVHVAFNPTGQVNGLLDLYSQSLSNRADNGAANIPIDKVKAHVVLMTGQDDEIWPSPQMANGVCEKLNEKHHGQCEHYNYPKLDHLLNYEMLKEGSDIHGTFIQSLK